MTELMARIEGGNLAALETKYHLECLTALCNCYRSFKGKVSVQMPSAISSTTGNEFKDHNLFTLCRKKLLGFFFLTYVSPILWTFERVGSALLTDTTHIPIHCGLNTYNYLCYN